MNIDQDGTIDLTDDTCDGVAEIGGQVWNVAQLEKLLEARGSTSNKINLLDIFCDGNFEQKVVATRKITFKHPQLFSGCTIPKLEVNPIHRFYLKIFALEDQVGNNNSKFRHWGAKRRGGRKCIAELDRYDQSITFSFVSGGHEKPLVSYWFPSMARSIHRIYYDNRSSSLKIEWQAGRKLYAQFRPSHYK
jgi:hypothetical protein